MFRRFLLRLFGITRFTSYEIEISRLSKLIAERAKEKNAQTKERELQLEVSRLREELGISA